MGLAVGPGVGSREGYLGSSAVQPCRTEGSEMKKSVRHVSLFAFQLIAASGVRAGREWTDGADGAGSSKLQARLADTPHKDERPE